MPGSQQGLSKRVGRIAWVRRVPRPAGQTPMPISDRRRRSGSRRSRRIPSAPPPRIARRPAPTFAVARRLTPRARRLPAKAARARSPSRVHPRPAAPARDRGCRGCLPRAPGRKPWFVTAMRRRAAFERTDGLRAGNTRDIVVFGLVASAERVGRSPDTFAPRVPPPPRPPRISSRSRRASRRSAIRRRRWPSVVHLRSTRPSAGARRAVRPARRRSATAGLGPGPRPVRPGRACRKGRRGA